MRIDKTYFDNLLKPLGVVLDEEQRAAITSNAPHLLIVAGAGAGKTTTMVAKAKYLVDSGKATPNEILIISFTNHAVHEFQEQLQKLDSKARWNVLTFHKLGYKICNADKARSFNIIEENAQSKIILDSFKKLIQDKKFAEDVILFFGSYFSQPFDEINATAEERYFNKHNTLKTCIDDYIRTDVETLNQQKISIKYENLRSREEVNIANFLFLHGIDYEYEKEYPYQDMKNHRPYTPDFYIKQDGKEAYIEHFGISEDGTSDRYNQEELERYKKHIKIKEDCHRRHNTKLISTYSRYNDENKNYLQDLIEQLNANGFKLQEPDYIDVCKCLVTANINQQYRQFVKLLVRFIQCFKSNNYNSPIEQFDKWVNDFKKQNKPRYYLFLLICKQCYIEYEAQLREKKCVDFEDMINMTQRALNEIKANNSRSNRQYKYILIDEYQDISKNRLDFAKLLSDYYGASVTAVGDDWL